MGVDYRPAALRRPPPAKQARKSVDQFAVGPVESFVDPTGLHPPGFKAGPFRDLEEAYRHLGDVGDALWCLPPFGEDYIVDVWIDDRRVFGEFRAAGWAARQARLECADMAKRNYAADAAPPAADVQAGVTPTRPPAGLPAGVRGATPPSGVNPDRRVEKQPGTGPMPPGLDAATGPAIHATKSGVEVVDGEDADAARLSALKAAASGGGDVVFVSIGRTVSPKQYESIRVDVGRCRALREGEDFDAVENEVIAELAGKVRQLEEEALALFSAGQQG